MTASPRSESSTPESTSTSSFLRRLGRHCQSLPASSDKPLTMLLQAAWLLLLVALLKLGD